ncbi:hypothetical protein [Sphingobacterium wenxiniae]|uniref:Uncharacterized protein n=1 Tax=Sphingobacterium wenxiniae TaxID=683125 RepID=A0A1I6RWX4_9SPHI|nr:hypothetical protein [Sphingobacterium wenxiniae]SFS69207.1 hypothetical protein SAMN05660206_1045 [Sphingobacterium wenxiniae]
MLLENTIKIQDKGNFVYVFKTQAKLPLLLSVFLLLLWSCSGGSCNVVPDRSFNTNINQAEHIGVFATNGWAYADGGYAGLIVYNMGTQSNPQLIAYDRCSTVNPEKGNRVYVEGMLIVDRESGAKWLLRDGSPAELAECPLKPYRVGQSGNIFYVQN